MTMAIFQDFLLRSAVLNMLLLLWWFLFFAFAHDWMYRLHSRWFTISVEKFDAIHYAGMAFYKIAIFLLFLVPYLALLIVT